MKTVEVLINEDKRSGFDLITFKGQYLARVKPAVKKNLNRKYRRNAGLGAFLAYVLGGNVLDEILIGEPVVLKTHIEHIKENFPEIITQYSKRIATIFGYETRFRDEEDRGLWLAKLLSTRACPYCNAQYTLFVKHRKEDGEIVRKKRFQFDHFYSQTDYPYLSVSLYNLIPSCASCNHAKLDKPFDLLDHFHPYDPENDLDRWATFDVQVKFDEAGRPTLNAPAFTTDELDAFQAMGLKEGHIEVKFKPRHRNSPKSAVIERHNDTFFIDGIYERHKDRALEVVKNSVIYTTSMQDHLMKIDGLFAKDRSFILRFILGAHGTAEEIPLRPLNKLVRDTAIQYGLIDEFGELTI